MCPNKEMDRKQLQIIENLFRLSDFMSSTIRPHARNFVIAEAMPFLNINNETQKAV